MSDYGSTPPPPLIYGKNIAILLQCIVVGVEYTVSTIDMAVFFILWGRKTGGCLFPD